MIEKMRKHQRKAFERAIRLLQRNKNKRALATGMVYSWDLRDCDEALDLIRAMHTIRYVDDAMLETAEKLHAQVIKR